MATPAKQPDVVTGKNRIPEYTYDSQVKCVAEARESAYCRMALRLQRGVTYTITEEICGAEIVFTATPVIPAEGP